MNSGRSLPSASKRSVSNRCTPRPERLIVLRKRAGMTLSVSMLAIGIGAATAVSVVNASIVALRGAQAPQRHGRRPPAIHDFLTFQQHHALMPGGWVYIMTNRPNGTL